MNNVDQAFIKLYAEHEAHASANRRTHGTRRMPATERRKGKTVQQATQRNLDALQQVFGTCFVDAWSNTGSSEQPPERERPCEEQIGEEQPSGEEERREFAPPLSAQLSRTTHLPAVLVAAAASDKPRGTDDEGAGVTYSRPFASLPLRSKATSAAATPQQDVREDEQPPHETERAKVIVDTAQTPPVPKPHFAVVQVEDSPEQPAEVVADQPADEKTDEPPAAESQQSETPFRPAWELDRLDWPAVVNRLFDEQPTRFDELVTHLIRLADEGNKRIAIGGCGRGVGATTLALCLARRLSEVVQTVALIDGNAAAPQLAKSLDVSLEAGWEDAIVGKQPAEETAVASLGEGITVLPMTKANAAPFDAAASGRIAAVMRQLAANHDIVLVDAGVFGTHDGPSIVGGKDKAVVDVAVIVRDVRRSHEEELRTALAELSEWGISAAAIAENFALAAVVEKPSRQAA